VIRLQVERGEYWEVGWDGSIYSSFGMFETFDPYNPGRESLDASALGMNTLILASCELGMTRNTGRGIICRSEGTSTRRGEAVFVRNKRSSL